jgi:peptidoglycan-N-acetylglucosamine deacetylase
MHDGGGNRERTVLALPLIIDGARARGFDFVPVYQLMGKTKADVMPPLPPTSIGPRLLNWIGFWFFSATMAGIALIFFLGDILMTGRLISVGVLAIYDRLRSHVYGTPEQIAAYWPRVAVLIPAYNEEKVIERTVQGALDSDYPNLRVIVIDDGSKDRTLEIARRAFAAEEAAGRVLILTKPNGGKAEALNFGLEHIGDAEVFVGIDADTIIAPDAICPHGTALPQSQSCCRGGQCQGRQPRQPMDALAGARIHHQPEFRAPSAQHHGRGERGAGRDRRLAYRRRFAKRAATISTPSPKTPI